MPVKNTSAYLNECIDSIIVQSYDQWELIAIDDNSDDGSWVILQQYADRYPQIQSYRNDGKGIISALRLALIKSKGTYITRMDSDDIMMPDKLKLMRSAIVEKKNLAVGLVKYISNTDLGEGYLKYAEWLNSLTLAENNFSEIYKECVIPSPCWMLHRDDFIGCGGFDPDIYPEDYDLTFRMKNYGMKICAVKEVIHLWRDHADRASRNDLNYLDNNFIDLKVKHFTNNDMDVSKPLVVWGAGKKGKKIISQLKDSKIKVHWICNNKRKIGTKIYDTMLHGPQSILEFNSPQVIIAVAQRDALAEIESYINKLEKKEVFYFC